MAFDPNDPDTKAALKAAVEEAVKKVEDPLAAKNTELLDEVKDLKKKLRASTEIKPEDVAALETENERLKGELTAAQKTVKETAVAAEKATKALEAESGYTTKLLVENGLRDALAANGVTNAVHQKAAMAMLAGGVQIAADGGTRVAKVGDKALADFVKEWAGGDEGKHFVTAPHNGGGGAGGGSGSGGGKTIARAAFDAMPQLERASFVKDGGKVVDQAA